MQIEQRKLIIIITIIMFVGVTVVGVFAWYNFQIEDNVVHKIHVSPNNTTNDVSSSDNDYISANEAIAIMKSASADGAPGATAVLTTYNGRPMYKVSWEGNYAYVDAVTGTVYDKYGATENTPHHDEDDSYYDDSYYDDDYYYDDDDYYDDSYYYY